MKCSYIFLFAGFFQWSLAAAKTIECVDSRNEIRFVLSEVPIDDYISEVSGYFSHLQSYGSSKASYSGETLGLVSNGGEYFGSVYPLKDVQFRGMNEFKRMMGLPEKESEPVFKEYLETTDVFGNLMLTINLEYGEYDQEIYYFTNCLEY